MQRFFSNQVRGPLSECGESGEDRPSSLTCWSNGPNTGICGKIASSLTQGNTKYHKHTNKPEQQIPATTGALEGHSCLRPSVGQPKHPNPPPVRPPRSVLRPSSPNGRFRGTVNDHGGPGSFEGDKKQCTKDPGDTDPPQLVWGN